MNNSLDFLHAIADGVLLPYMQDFLCPRVDYADDPTIRGNMRIIPVGPAGDDMDRDLNFEQLGSKILMPMLVNITQQYIPFFSEEQITVRDEFNLRGQRIAKPKKSGIQWIIDPLDGSMNFADYLDSFTTQARPKDPNIGVIITCLMNGQVEASWVGIIGPSEMRVACAQKDRGCWITDGQNWTQATMGRHTNNRIATSPNTMSPQFRQSVIATLGQAHMGIQSPRSSAHEIFGTLEGSIDGSIHRQFRAHDHSGFKLMVTEAQGAFYPLVSGSGHNILTGHNHSIPFMIGSPSMSGFAIQLCRYAVSGGS